MSADGAGSDGGPKQRFELYIKASAIDKETKGSCPICQHWFMITCLLGENQNDIDFKVYTVQADCPPKNFGVEQGWSKKFPVVMVLEGRDKRGQDLAGTKYDIFEELETFFEAINKDSRELKRKNAPNVAAMAAVENAYNAFSTALSAGTMNKRFSKSLRDINEFLESDPDCKFLVDDVLSFADCYLLPRLQHMRVAGKEYIDGFDDIPEDLTTLWQYLADAYQTEAFRSTMPSDQDIIFQYEKKAGSLSQRPRRKPRPTLQNFTYTMDVPQHITTMLQQRGDHRQNGDATQAVEEEPRVDISPQHLADEECAQHHEEQEEESGVSQTEEKEEEESAPVYEGVGDVEQSVAQVSLEQEERGLNQEVRLDEPQEVPQEPYEPVTSDEVAPTSIEPIDEPVVSAEAAPDAEESSAVMEEQSPVDVTPAVDDDVTQVTANIDNDDDDDKKSAGGETGEMETHTSLGGGGVTIVINQEEGEEGCKAVGNGAVVVDQPHNDNAANADGDTTAAAATTAE